MHYEIVMSFLLSIVSNSRPTTKTVVRRPFLSLLVSWSVVIKVDCQSLLVVRAHWVAAVSCYLLSWLACNSGVNDEGG